MRKFLVLSSFFLITPLLIIFSVGYYSFLAFYKSNPKPLVLSASNEASVAYAALPLTQDISQAQIGQEDARVEIVRQFFAEYGSRLEPYAQNVVEAADNYGIDFRIIPAIAMQESTLCKKEIPGTFNCWGFGIYGKKVTSFDNYAQAIDVITRTLAKDYKSKGLETPFEIMSKYNPTNHNDWARHVTGFMSELQ